MDDEAAPTPAELALNVDRYVLPKFKVAIDLAKRTKPNMATAPATGSPARCAQIIFSASPWTAPRSTVKASGMDVAEFHAASAQGKTDADGEYRFDLRLPDYFAGRPLTQGAAAVLIEATVKDSAGHAETRGEPSPSAIRL